MDKRIGILLIVAAVLVFVASGVEYINSQNLISHYSNETGTCYIGGTCLHEQANMTFIILAIAGAVVLVLGIVVIVLSSKTEKPEQKKEKAGLKIDLKGEQKIVYDIVLESGGSCLQGEIVEKSKMNKVHVSRILDKLEMRGLIERRRHGMSNIVVAKTGSDK